MNSLENDFILIDNFNGRIKLEKNQIKNLCDRHLGIGADGLILVESSVDAHCFMNDYNPDGLEAGMCANSIRCVTGFLKNEYFKDEDIFKIKTRAGIKEVNYEDNRNFLIINEKKEITDRGSVQGIFNGTVEII